MFTRLITAEAVKLCCYSGVNRWRYGMSEEEDPKIIVVEDKEFNQAFYQAWKQIRKESGKPPTMLEQWEELRNAVMQVLGVLFAPIKYAVLFYRDRPVLFWSMIFLAIVVMFIVDWLW